MLCKMTWKCETSLCMYVYLEEYFAYRVQFTVRVHPLRWAAYQRSMLASKALPLVQNFV
jgi:hypothetical protein